MIISLIGFMATGKTTIGNKLAKKLDYEFIDLDNYIEELTNMSVKEIFEKKGEKHFRTLENKLLKKVLIQYHDLVISPGGGIITSQENIKLLKEKTIPFLLKAKPKSIVNRIDDITKRPLLNKKNPEEIIKELLKERGKYYNQFENVIITDNKEIYEIMNEILNRLEDMK